MKKIAILIISTALLLSLSMVTPAATNYVEFMTASSDWKSEFSSGSKYEGDFDGIILGYDLPVNRFRFGLEYMDTDYEGDDTGDISGYDLKVGYRILQSSLSELVLNISYSKYESDLWKTEYDGVCLGASFYYDLHERLNLETSVSYSLNGSMKIGSKEKDADHLAAKLKVNYYFTDNFGLALAYRLYKYEVQDNPYKMTAKGFTVGVNYRF
jgi:opacity protein-like surface antigen